MIILSGFSLFSQQYSYISSVINIEVPVRVYKGSDFVDTLGLQDFELTEDGVLQKIEAVYLVKKTSIQKEEGPKKFQPQVSRHFVLLFELTHYLPRVEQAIDAFFENVIQPADMLTVVTPLKTYKFNSQVLARIPKKNIAGELKQKLRFDVEIASAEYKNALRQLQEIWIDSDTELDLKVTTYANFMAKLETLRQVDQKKLTDFADFLKKTAGQKYVYLFYEREVVPQIDLQTISEVVSLNQDRQDILMNISDLFELFRREVTFNVDTVKKAFSDSSITVHFLFITETRSRDDDITMARPTGMRMTEASEDIYGAFNQIAQATGGIVDSSANPVVSFQKAVDASDNYYLIYYSPQNYTADGKFREIKVKVKSGSYHISHRAGYFAN